MGETTRRRERLRTETVREIKALALKHMADSGAAGLSLRAVARDMGMTAGAIYTYYATRDDLVTALITDVYTALNDALQHAYESADALPDRIRGYADAFRAWAIANPQEFQLVYGDPIPGYRVPPGGPAAEQGKRACALLTRIIADAWPPARDTEPGGAYGWDDFAPDFAAVIRAEFPALPPAAAALALRVWGRLHGPVALEVYGHLGPQVAEPARLYRAEVDDIIAGLGL